MTNDQNSQLNAQAKDNKALLVIRSVEILNYPGILIEKRSLGFLE